MALLRLSQAQSASVNSSDETAVVGLVSRVDATEGVVLVLLHNYRRLHLFTASKVNHACYFHVPTQRDHGSDRQYLTLGLIIYYCGRQLVDRDVHWQQHILQLSRAEQITLISFASNK